MTDLSLIGDELRNVMGLSDDDIEKYHSIIEGTSEFVSRLLNSDADENSVSVVHLCAVRAYYQILLISQGEEVTSFKAGDVSFTRASSALDSVKELYKTAIELCSGKMKSPIDSFAFKVV